MTIRDFSGLLELSNRYRSGAWLFRGVSNAEYELLPKVGRGSFPAGWERHMFKQFCRELPAYMARVPSSEWELLAIAQHHGLATRLLDWTENPLVAAYFASTAEDRVDGAIYALNTVSVVDSDVSPFDFPRVAKYRPNHVTNRITAQRGQFTIHSEPSKPLKIGDSKRGAYKVRKITVRASSKKRIRWDLSRLNVNARSLFPDIEGLTKFFSWVYSETDPVEQDTSDADA